MRISTKNIKLQTTYLKLDQSSTELWNRFRSNYVITNSCWQWTGSRSISSPKNRPIRYYGILKINGKAQYAHRISYALHNGPIDHGLVVMHMCDNPLCVNPAHLKIGTAAENSQDAVNKGRIKSLENHGRAKLTNSQVQDIRRMKDLVTCTDIAKMYGVSIEAISAIMLGKTWKKLPWPTVEEKVYDSPEVVILGGEE